MAQIPILYNCFLNNSGYATAAQDYILALDQSSKYDIKIEIFGTRPTRPSVSDERYEFLMKLQKKELNFDAIQVLHCIPPIQKRVTKLKKNIAFVVFETFQPDKLWIDILNNNDAMIAVSKFNYKVFAHEKITKPLFYLPHCFDINIYNKNVKSLKKFDIFTFLFMGTWKVRKGYIQLIEAWLTEFNTQDNVQLVIKTDKPQYASNYVEKIKKELGKSKGFAPILFEKQVLGENLMPSFMKSFDCLVLPSLGEGFYIPALHSMALGVPVIISNFSGCQDYANNDTATLLEPSGFILHNDMDGIPQFKNKKWAFIAVKDIREKMRYAINNIDILKDKSKVAYNYVHENFNYNKVANLFGEMIGEIYG